MRNPKQVRLLGLVQLILGLGLVGFIGLMTFYFGTAMLNPTDEYRAVRFTGTPTQAKIVLILFGLVIAFGAGSAASGLWQIVTGRRNKWIALVALAIAAVVFVFALTTQLIF